MNGISVYTVVEFAVTPLKRTYHEKLGRIVHSAILFDTSRALDKTLEVVFFSVIFLSRPFLKTKNIVDFVSKKSERKTEMEMRDVVMM